MPSSFLYGVGVRIVAPNNRIFVPGFLCQLHVAIMSKLNVSLLKIFLFFSFDFKHVFREDIVNVYQNGIVVRCPGLFQGEVLVMLENNKRSLLFVMMVTNPDLGFLLDIFQSLVQRNFPQCI